MCNASAVTTILLLGRESLQNRQGGDLAGLRGELVLSGHDPAAGDSGQQMRRGHVTSFRSTQGFAVDRHHHATLPSGGVTGQQPRPDHQGAVRQGRGLGGFGGSWIPTVLDAPGAAAPT